MGKGFALVFVILFLAASLVIVDKPVFASSTVGDSWVEKAPMPTARGGLGVAVVDGKIYAVGGATSDSAGFLGTNEQYDPATDKWTSKAPMPTPRAYFAVAAYQGKIYCIGGQIGVEQEPAADYLWGPKQTSVNEVYDVATNTWGTAAPGPFGMYVEAEAIGGLILVGGFGLSWAYNITADSWSNTTAFPLYSWYQNGDPTTFIQIDVNNKTLKTGVQDGAAVETSGINAPIRAYVIGSNINEVYDPYADSWSKGATMPTQRGHFGMAVVNDTIYAIGGFTTGANEQYFPLDYGTPDPSYVLEHTPPTISILSPENQTYANSSIPLIFTANKLVNWTGYSVDGNQNITINGNLTLSELSNGLHNVTVYSNDTYGNIGSSEIINFTVAKPESFPITVIAAVSAVVAVAIVAAGLLVYHKKHKRRTEYE